MAINYSQIFLWLLFLTVIVKHGLFWTAVWQIKEYRLDRLRDYLSTPEGKKAVFNFGALMEFAALVLILTLINRTGWLLLVTIVFLAEAVLAIQHLKKRTFIKPSFTAKAGLISAGTAILALAMALLVFYNRPVLFYPGLLVIALVAGALVAGIILLFYPLSFFLKQRIIAVAKNKIALAKNLKVIGITGSYGKTSVKELTYQVLARHFQTAKTEKNNNTEIGVAQTVNRLNLAETELFIAEMGAYKIGEIKRLCDLVKPSIGILTGIDNQHGALFGGLDNIIKAKAEIILALPIGGTAILNYENKFIRQLVLPANLKKISYGFAAADLIASKITFNGQRQSFNVTYRNQNAEFSTELIGRHNILNLLAAMAAALALGLTLAEIKADVSKVTMVDQTLKLINRGQLILLDDSYNANFTGVLAALETLGQFKQAKMVVLDDILELGRETKKIHQAVAEAVAECAAAKIILTGKNYSRLLAGCLKALNVPETKILIKPAEISSYLKSLNGENVILFEGRRSGNYLKLFL
ncbi:MAG: UDP-N-acetylmuramoyl-tripeptide--D-alanyl-D-alanine ligase [Candidatus Komeilibacteria bacterium]|nr:UDP-N-acetylmuramoyl-tripeptide--D-alanyl-D-alanine ligase [Candidatus Komeilibacteria bacterium]